MADHPVVVSGIAAECGLGGTFSDLILNLKARKTAEFHPYFDSLATANAANISFNPFVDLNNLSQHKDWKKLSVHRIIKSNLFRCLEELIVDGKLTQKEIQAKDSRIIVAAQGNLLDLNRIDRFIQQNDILDLKGNPHLALCEADSFRESELMAELKQRFKLSHMPFKVYASSASGQLAVFLAKKFLRRDDINRVIVIGWFFPTLQDINFFAQNNLLSERPSLPFSNITKGVTLSAGIAGLLLEKHSECIKRDGEAKAEIASMHLKYDQSTSINFHSLTKTLSECTQSALKEAKLKPEDIDIVFPHGNGSKLNDEKEASAIDKIFGASAVPVLNYKHQTGYFSAASPLFDIALASHFLSEQVVIAPHYPDTYQTNSNLKLIGAVSNYPTQNPENILKTVIGIDGSTSCLTLRRCA